MSALLAKHLDAIAASLQLLLAQVEAARHALTIPAPATSAPSVPDRCVGIPEERCVLRDPDAGRPLMGGVTVCVGCQERLELGR